MNGKMPGRIELKCAVFLLDANHHHPQKLPPPPNLQDFLVIMHVSLVMSGLAMKLGPN